MSEYFDKKQIWSDFNAALAYAVYQCSTVQEVDEVFNRIGLKVSAVCGKRKEQILREHNYTS